MMKRADSSSTAKIPLLSNSFKIVVSILLRKVFSPLKW